MVPLGGILLYVSVNIVTYTSLGDAGEERACAMDSHHSLNIRLCGKGLRKLDFSPTLPCLATVSYFE